jgi:hypothetical protein
MIETMPADAKVDIAPNIANSSLLVPQAPGFQFQLPNAKAPYMMARIVIQRAIMVRTVFILSYFSL